MKRNLAGDALAGASIYTPKMAGSRGGPPGFHFMKRFVSLRVVAVSPTAIITAK